jgi:hypothetical protein
MKYHELKGMDVIWEHRLKIFCNSGLNDSEWETSHSGGDITGESAPC